MATTLSGTTTVEWLPDAYVSTDGTTRGIWFAADSRFPGAWGEGDSRDEALDDMCDVLRDWWALKVEDGHDDLPPCDVTLTSSRGSDV